MRLRDASFYADLAKVVRRGEMMDAERLIEHLRIVGYNQVDVVEMPGEFAHRGGLLDVYPPEQDRPVRVEFFGDEIESIRKFDPETQRSAAVTDEVVLLPLTETPVEEETLAAINARLTGERLAGSEEMIERAVRATGVTVFPGWELYAPAAGATETSSTCCPTPPSILDEPDLLKETHDNWWTKVTERSRAQPGRQSGAAGRSLSLARAMAAAAATGRPPSRSSSWASRATTKASTSPCKPSRPRASTDRSRP